MIETDMLIALASKSDKHHNKAKNLLRKMKTVKLSPYSLIELDFLISSKSLIVKLPDFYDALRDTFAYYGILILASQPNHFAKAWLFRKKYGLTFFDSLHAATAVEENEVLISFDKKYGNIKELKYKNPYSPLLEGIE